MRHVQPESLPRILIVEDDVILAMDAAEEIASTGARVSAVRSMKEAFGILDTENITGAILDFDVLDGTVTPLAKRLDEIGIPYRIVSGTSKADIARAGLNPAHFRSKPASYKSIFLAMD